MTITTLADIARHGSGLEPIRLGQGQRIDESAAWVASTMAGLETRDEPVRAYYGINTGFGDNAGRAAFSRQEDAAHLSRNLLLSHSTGVGDQLPLDVVRAALAIRIANLAHGYSGVRPVVINTLVEMLNAGVYPACPRKDRSAHAAIWLRWRTWCWCSARRCPAKTRHARRERAGAS